MISLNFFYQDLPLKQCIGLIKNTHNKLVNLVQSIIIKGNPIAFNKLPNINGGKKI